jgi:hypothetical protein
MNETPILRQLLICEKLIFERGTNNVSLINCHTHRSTYRFPSPPMSFAVYGLLADGYGTFTLVLRMVRVETDEVVFQRIAPMVFADRLQTKAFTTQINQFVFPAAGLYEVILLANQELLATAAFELKEVP